MWRVLKPFVQLERKAIRHNGVIRQLDPLEKLAGEPLRCLEHANPRLTQKARRLGRDDTSARVNSYCFHFGS
jgi:hypothetical protein